MPAFAKKFLIALTLLFVALGTWYAAELRPKLSSVTPHPSHSAPISPTPPPSAPVGSPTSKLVLPPEKREVPILAKKREVSTSTPLRALPALKSEPTGVLTKDGDIRFTNEERAKAKIALLSESEILDGAAEEKVEDMFARQYFEHVSPAGVGMANLVEKDGYDYIAVGENLALGNFSDDHALVQAWMNSPGHRANILNPRYRDIGVAVRHGVFEGREVWLAVQAFGKNASACPTVDKTASSSITLKQSELSMLQPKLSTLKEGITALGTTQKGIVAEIETLAAQGNDLVSRGNAKIEKGNEVYQTSGSKEKASSYWNDGENLQHEGQKIFDQVKQRQSDLETLSSNIEKLIKSYNMLISEASLAYQAVSDMTKRYNASVQAFNACLDS
ncbi:MAG: hypothetical protein A3H69_05845 [Candidatus Sungbacteria bacterium RIFCSPLOWO2_02_FULL_47_9]|uniref:SCP domain-containing protein n=1 Tax=Candidatus Sungbacteria bacterium RIFCSPHIGHO2_01_FULL_47_32 TaxID=1802264 RepID=A0A1G2K2E9_9BACT|nr:MAG: RNA polymerase sigma factor [Parcubacteria group bacterium GW2011_GWA2_47_10]OGZ93609.1 MAG: hypothetical protein A2633_04620 [Candidatus Sungbacteria bacterium RIFCSPHIGHO2_01_FULL_47_32]OHA05451.1 MAG: hypothetical protein A3A28_03080 [Candidatus Sungbacteria bacterium RIFCSPLOWO2_01_FULL_47_32]OHA08667.1 MAG: hypothetical protein A3H69_05845 [Candidatus Sungbacteria bacterium RIFCSPLOWO2_02_FULL_47_9]